MLNFAIRFRINCRVYIKLPLNHAKEEKRAQKIKKLKLKIYSISETKRERTL